MPPSYLSSASVSSDFIGVIQIVLLLLLLSLYGVLFKCFLLGFLFSYVDLLVLYRSYLYGAVLDKPKQSVAVAAQSKPGKAGVAAGAVTQQALSKARVIKTETSASVLSDLVMRWNAFKDDVRQVRLHRRCCHCRILGRKCY